MCKKTVLLYLLVLTFGHAAHSHFVPKAWIKKKAVDTETASVKQCELEMLTVDELARKLEEIVGEADKKLTEQDYGTPLASELAEDIKLHANALILKTRSDNALALESFLFAAEIAPPKKRAPPQR